MLLTELVSVTIPRVVVPETVRTVAVVVARVEIPVAERVPDKASDGTPKVDTLNTPMFAVPILAVPMVVEAMVVVAKVDVPVTARVPFDTRDDVAVIDPPLKIYDVRFDIVPDSELRIEAKRLVEVAFVVREFVVNELVFVALVVVELIALKLFKVTVVTLKLLIDALVEKKLVEVAFVIVLFVPEIFVAEKLVLVAFVVVPFKAIKFWNDESPETTSVPPREVLPEIVRTVAVVVA